MIRTKKLPKLSILFCAFIALFMVVPAVFAQDCTDCEVSDTQFKAEITSVTDGKCVDFRPEEYDGSEDMCQLVLIKGLQEDQEGKIFEVLENLTQNVQFSSSEYAAGDKVWINASTLGDQSVYSIIQVDRSVGLIWLVAIFVILVIAIGRLRGAMSLLGMAVSAFAIFAIAVPAILSGKDPILFGALAAVVILVGSIYLSHGLNKKTSIALIGTVITLLITVFLAFVFSKVLKLTGFGDEDAYFLVQSSQVPISMSKVLIASIFLGSIGILDDVTVSQVAVIAALKEENPSLGAKELFAKAMNVGQDHIASMVNTLFLVYAGASLPLVLLLRLEGISFGHIVHYEQFTEEIVRIVVGSIGLVLAVPITTYLAAESYAKNDVSKKL